MSINIYDKTQELLHRLANSIHDRDIKHAVYPRPFCFHSTEVLTATKWIEEFIEEVKKDCICV